MSMYILYIYIHAKLFLYFFIPFVSFPLLHKTSTCGLQPQCTKRLHRYHEHCWTTHRTGNSTFPPFKNLGMDQSLYFLYKFGWIGGMHIHHFLTQSAKTKTHIQYQHIQTYVYVYIYTYTYTYIYIYVLLKKNHLTKSPCDRSNGLWVDILAINIIRSPLTATVAVKLLAKWSSSLKVVPP